MSRPRISHGQNLTFHSVGLTAMLASVKYDRLPSIVADDSLPSSSMLKAVRDGNLPVVEDYMKVKPSHATDLDNGGFSCLHYAAKHNRHGALDLMLSKGANPNIEGADRCTPLHIACKYKANAAAVSLLKASADPNVTDNRGKTPLHIAARRGQIDLVQLLLDSGCHVSPVDNDRCTPLHDACLQKNMDIVQTLLNYYANIELEDLSGKTPLIVAAGHGHTDIVRCLLVEADNRQMKEDYVNREDDEGQAALHAAVENGVKDIVKLLLDNQANVNNKKHNNWRPLHIAATHDYAAITSELLAYQADIDAMDNEYMTPLHRAAVFGCLHVMDVLLKAEADLEAVDIFSFTPLLCAAQRGQTISVEFLLERGASLTSCDDSNRTCLHLAVESENYDTVVLLAHEALLHPSHDIRESVDKSGQTALHYAALTGQHVLVQTLLEYGALPQARDEEEKTPLHLAAENGKDECVEVLLQHNLTELNHDDIDGNTPLLLACKSGHDACVTLLLAYGASLCSRNENYLTPLMVAAKHGHPATVKELLEHNPMINATDKNKNTALHHACQQGQSEVVQLLLDHSANVKSKNILDETPLDRAVFSQMTEAVVTMLKHSSWKETMSVRDGDGFSPMRNLIRYTPEGAEVIFNNCVEVNDDGTEVTFNFEYIDPPPDDVCCRTQKYLGLTTMVQYKREELLSHTLAQTALKNKWQSFGRVAYSITFVNFILFLGMLNTYLVITTPIREIKKSDDALKHDGKWLVNIDKYDPHGLTLIFNKMLVSLICVTLVCKIFTNVVRGLDSLLDPWNWLHMILLGMTLLFFMQNKATSVVPWRIAWIAVFLSWINLIMYLRRMDFVGIYIIMFTTVIKSLLKATLLWCLICIAFASAFCVVLFDIGKEFQSIWISLMATFSFTTGEIEFQKVFIDTATQNDLYLDSHILGSLFIVVVPVALMNLLVGIAVGDIEKVSQSAYLTRIRMQVDFLYDTERSMPKHVQQWFYQKTKTISISKTQTKSGDSVWKKSLQQVLEKTSGKDDYMDMNANREQGRTMENIHKIKHVVAAQDKRINIMHAALQKQAKLIREMHAIIVPNRSLTRVTSWVNTKLH